MKIKPIPPAGADQNVFKGRVIMGRDAIRLIPSSVQTDLERSIAERIEIPPTPTVIKKFANGETYVNIKDDMRNKKKH